MDDKLRQQLLNEIDKSGFPLEISVVEQLRNAMPLVFPNLSYADSEDRPHEIDALAFLDKEELEENWPYGPIGVNLLVECKTSKQKPWVFFKDSDDPVTIVSGLVDRLRCLTDIPVQRPKSLLIGCNNTALSGHHYNDSSLPLARTYFEAFGKDAGKGIYQAVTNIWYALDFYERFFKESSADGARSPARRRTNFLHGVIVFKGTLVSAQMTEDGSYQVAEVPHIMLRTIDCLTNKSLPFGSERETIIDIVREDYLDEYLVICQEDLRLCARHLKDVANAGWIAGEMKANELFGDR